VAFSPDGGRLATVAADGTVVIRHLVLQPEDACALIAGEVTADDLAVTLGDMTPQACTNLH